MVNVSESLMRSRYSYPSERESVGQPTTMENVDSAVFLFVIQTKELVLDEPVLEHQRSTGIKRTPTSVVS